MRTQITEKSLFPPIHEIGREIGHVFVEYGHPDQDATPGHAALPHTKYWLNLNADDHRMKEKLEECRSIFLETD